MATKNIPSTATRYFDLLSEEGYRPRYVERDSSLDSGPPSRPYARDERTIEFKLERLDA